MNPTRRRFLAGLSVLAVAPIAAACGSESGSEASDTTGGSSNGASESAAPEDAFPVTITHKYGETTVGSAPKRVVTIGLTDQDTLLALGIVPVGVTWWFGDKELKGVYPWADEALGDADLPELLEDADGVQVEKIAALTPDLIIGQYSGLTEDDYKTLSGIAPVVAQSGDYADYSTPWEEASVRIGTAVGRKDEVQAIVDDATAQIKQVASDHPEFAGQTAAVVTPYEGLFLYGPGDPRSRMLTDFGFELPELITGADDSEFGVTVSSERTSELDDIGVAVWLDLTTDKQVEGLFEATTAAKEGRFTDISEKDGNFYVAHSFITPLSVPYLLERYVPQLAAAADGDPATEVPAVTD